MTHAGYLKLFQLYPHKDLHQCFNVVMLDEAQDSNDCTVDIVLQAKEKGCGVIMVGDPHQVGVLVRTLRGLGCCDVVLHATAVLRRARCCFSSYSLFVVYPNSLCPCSPLFSHPPLLSIFI